MSVMIVRAVVVSVHGNYSFAKILDNYPGGGSDIFCHHDNLTYGKQGKRSLIVGQTIEFELSTRAGRPYAKSIRLISMPGATTSKQKTLDMKEEPNGNR